MQICKRYRYSTAIYITNFRYYYDRFFRDLRLVLKRDRSLFMPGTCDSCLAPGPRLHNGRMR